MSVVHLSTYFGMAQVSLKHNNRECLLENELFLRQALFDYIGRIFNLPYHDMNYGYSIHLIIARALCGAFCSSWANVGKK